MVNGEFTRGALRITAAGPPGTGADLAGMATDFHLCLTLGLEEIDSGSVRVHPAFRPEALLEVTCRAAPGVPLQEAAEALRRAWLESLSYDFAEAHHLAVDEARSTLRFATQVGLGGFHVTGVVRIERDR